MKTHITYLLGAGSSFNSLPLGNKLAHSMEKLSERLRDLKEIRFEQLIDDLTWLADNAKNFETVDSYAKHLHMHIIDRDKILNYGEIEQKIDKSVDYRRLKNALNAFLIIAQYKKLDFRYNKLLSHLLIKEDHSVYSIKKEVKILSWNYDNQIEIAFSSNYKNSSTKDVYAMIASYPCPYLLGDKRYHYSNKPFDPINSKISIVHLNGVAGLCNNKSDYEIIEIINSNSESEIIAAALSVYSSEDSFLNFSWDTENQQTIDLAIQKAINTEILVIIGYSLPRFNKNIDTKVFSSFSKLKKVVFQNTNYKDQFEIKEELKNRGIPTSVQVIFNYDTDSFFIPDELD